MTVNSMVKVTVLTVSGCFLLGCPVADEPVRPGAVDGEPTGRDFPLGPEMVQLERDLSDEAYRATILSWKNYNDHNGEMGRADLPDNAPRFAKEHGGVEAVKKDPTLRVAYERRLKIDDEFLKLMASAYEGLGKLQVYDQELARLRRERDEPAPQATALPARVSIEPILPSPEAAGQWFRWRGPSGHGHSEETGLPGKWDPENGIAWKTPIPGQGNSSPVMWGDRIYLTSAFDGGKRRGLVCVRLQDGEVLWIKDAPSVKPESLTMMKNGWASATPVVDGERVIVFFGNTGLVAFSLDGEQLWHEPMPWFDGTHGTGASPVLCRQHVILFQEHNRGKSIGIALDKTTGNVVWKVERPTALGWCTPLPLRIGERDELIYGASRVIIGYDPATGDELWTCRGPTREVVPTIVHANGLVYSCSGRNGPTLAIRPGGSGDVTETHLAWRVIRGAPHVPSPVVVGDRIYFANDTGILTCLDAISGKTVYQKRLKGKFTASPVAADGKLYFTNERGDTFVIREGPEPEILSVNSLGETTLASMAVTRGRLYIRTDAHLYAIE